MTASKLDERERRSPGKRAQPQSLASSLASRCRAAALEEEPDAETDRHSRYVNDPVGFARDGFGVELWSAQQTIVELVRDHSRVAVASGHKIGKSLAYAVLALWFYCSFPGARVIITAATDRQVNGIIWREIRRLLHKRKFDIPYADECHELARSGLKNRDDFSEIVGFTARESEAMAGVSGEYLLYLVDEASGVPDAIFEAIQGNRAAGVNCKVAMISNPTRNEGEFFDAFHGAKAHSYKTLVVSSETTPNVKAGRIVIPGLATRDYIEEMRRDWGEKSMVYGYRVRGEFPILEERKVCSLADIEAAKERWLDVGVIAAAKTERLFFGVDPAGPGDGGDESAYAPRRGNMIYDVHRYTALSEAGHVAQLLDLIKLFGRPNERPPVVVVDVTGPIGHKVYGHLAAHLIRHPRDYELVRVNSSDRAVREPHIYDRQRDELHANFRNWLREGGAIPTDTKLEKDLHAPEWRSDHRGRIKATDKTELRKILGRSPDSGDAVMLSTWEPLSLRMQEEEPPEPHEEKALERGALDAYGGLDCWRT